jgi:hypothetical protein
MAARSLDRSPNSDAEQRHAPFGRMFLVAASVAVAGLGSAGPALASDLPGMPAVPGVPEAPPEITIPALPPETMEPPVVVTEIDAENIDVSVDVLGSGEDDAPAAEEGSSPVVSPDSESDTTPPAHSSAGGADAEASSGGVNTNVSVRVLSPGSSGGATQGSTGGGGDVAPAGATPAEAGPDTAPAATTTPDAPPDSEQYHDDNSQYQSEEQIESEPWSWQWILTIDCSGKPTSTSVNSGDPTSLEWAWDWAWEWGCPEAEAPVKEPSSTTERAPPSTQPEPQARAGPASTPSSSAAPEPTEPWSWTWTFTFCGETETFTTQAGAGTPLTWTWDWTWNWSCGSAPEDVDTSPVSLPAPTELPATSLPEPSAATASPGVASAPAADSIQIPAMTFTVGPHRFDTGTAGEALDLPPAPSLPSQFVVNVGPPSELAPVVVAIPPAIPPSSAAPAVPLQGLPFPLGAAPLELGPHRLPQRAPVGRAWSPPTRAVAPTLPPLLPRAAIAAGNASAAREARPETKKRAQVTHARPDSHPPLPLAPRSRHGAGSTSASGGASSALLVGIVALTGFVLLVAPGRGRRLDVARELSPRGLDRSPIDHPG